MTIDSSNIGTWLPTTTLVVDRGRLRNFAKATGQTDPVYLDVDAARRAGHPDLPVPPTFFFALEMDDPDPFSIFKELHVDIRDILHGEQRFEYLRMAYAGDELTSIGQIADVYTKKNGQLTFLVRDYTIVDRAGNVVVRAQNTVVVKQRSTEDVR